MAMTAEKARFIQQLVRQGQAAPAMIQRALKERFGSGVTISELAPFIRGQGKTPSRAERSARPARKGVRRPHEVPTSAPAAFDPGEAPYVVKWWAGSTAETVLAGSLAEAQRAVETAVQQGASPKAVAVYRRKSAAVDVKATIGVQEDSPPITSPQRARASENEEARAPEHGESRVLENNGARVPESGVGQVYEAYGRAMFACQNLEHQIRALLWGEKAGKNAFETEAARRARRKKLAKATFGQMIQKLEKSYSDHPVLISRVKKVLKTRNRLARGYFTETSVLQSLESEDGRQEIISQCEHTVSEGRSLWNEVNELGSEALDEIGPTETELWSKVGVLH